MELVGAPHLCAGKERFSAPDCHPDRSAPGFPTSLHYPKLRMRLSLTKAAYAVASSAAYRKSGFSAGNGSALGVGSLQSAADKLLIPKNRFHPNE
jgi:hypothetical protein